VEICVADSGIGFSDKAAERLFEPFTRLVGAEVASGAGIGMATARRIMDRFDGRISARVLPGQGAIFTMSFPTFEVAPEADAPSAIPVPCQLLLVDDSVEDRLIARRFIDKDLFTILEADSAEAAMKILRRETVHVVLSDFRMPGTDGLELLQQIRSHYPHIRTMLCSGGQLPEAVAGHPVIQAHFEKPPNAAALSEAVFGEGDVPEAA
jgi:two-component system cell cycle sensor histidine kinase/response regulator CckA